ncbi:MAG: DUF5333 domain-containing protein [Paracoccaceae bacterium]|nr:DUF5333 domain-containing protein [Paracoccaceae bacterium]
MKVFSIPVMAALVVVSLGLPAAAGAAGSLRDLKPVDDGLKIVAIGNAIRKTCPTISARKITAFFYMRGLAEQARAAGFSDAEIETYVENPIEKARVVAAARAYLASKGAKPDDPDSHCAVGRAEIERNSQVGRLLRMN